MAESGIAYAAIGASLSAGFDFGAACARAHEAPPPAPAPAVPTYPPFPKLDAPPLTFTEVDPGDGVPFPLQIANDVQGSAMHKKIALFAPGTIRSSLIYRLLIPMYGKTVADGMHSLKDPTWDAFSGNKFTRHGVLYEPLGFEILHQAILYGIASSSPPAGWRPEDLRFRVDHYYRHWDPELAHVYSSPDAEFEDRVSRFEGFFRSCGMSAEEARAWGADRISVELKHPYVRMYPSLTEKKDHSCQTQFQADCARCDVILYVAVFVPEQQRLRHKPMGPEEVDVQIWVARRSAVFAAWMRENLIRARQFALDPQKHHLEWKVVGLPPFDRIEAKRLAMRRVPVSESIRSEWRRRVASYRSGEEMRAILRDHGMTELPPWPEIEARS